MNEAIILDPFLPWAAIYVFGAAAALVTLLSLLRAPRGGVFRLIALAGLLALVANPQWRRAELTALSDIAVIIVDRSASQSLDGRDAVANSTSGDLQAALEALGDVEIVVADAGGAEETRIGDAVRAATADAARQRLAGVFVITDGQSADAIDASSLPPEAPVHILLTGRADEIDRRLGLVKAPRYGIVDEPVDVSFRIDDIGPDGAPLAPGSDALVVLRIDGEEVLRQAVPVGEEVSFAAPLERPGDVVIELETSDLAGELTTRNNIAVLRVSAIRDRLRVLLISGEPHAGERVWRNLLKSDPAIDLVHFTILRPTEKAQTDGALERELSLIEFPQDELFIEKLHEFDLLIFDRYTYRGVLNAFHFDNIARYVENGGAVLVASGPEFDGVLSLAARRNFSFILPVQPTGPAIEGAFRARLNEVGERHPVAAGLPEQEIWGRWFRAMPVRVLRGQNLMETPAGSPLLVLDRVGDGRVGVILSDHVWLWARGFDGGGPHAELLRRVAHWLMKEPELEEERLILSSSGDTLTIERRTLADAAGDVTLTAPDGGTREIAMEGATPGRFTARLPDMQRGLYRARSGELFAVGAVGLAAPLEYADVVMDARPLSPAAKASGGGVFRVRQSAGVDIPALRRVAPTASARSGGGWAGLTTRSASRRDSISLAPVAPPVAWLALIALSILAAWLVEGGRGARRAA